MSNLIPIHIRNCASATSIVNDAAAIAWELRKLYHGYVLITTDDEATAGTLTTEIARAFTDGNTPAGAVASELVINATGPCNTESASSLADIAGVETVRTRPGQDLNGWGQAIGERRPRLILAGEICANRMERLKALALGNTLDAGGNAVTLATVGIYGHAAAVERTLEIARGAGTAIGARNIVRTIEAITVHEPCPACHGFWTQTPRAELVEHYGEHLVAFIEAGTTRAERCWIRTQNTGRCCGACENRDAVGVAYSEIAWSWELMELLRRDGSAKLDTDLEAQRYRWTSTAANVFVKVLFGESRPEALGHPQIAKALATVRLNRALLKVIRETDVAE